MHLLWQRVNPRGALPFGSTLPLGASVTTFARMSTGVGVEVGGILGGSWGEGKGANLVQANEDVTTHLQSKQDCQLLSFLAAARTTPKTPPPSFGSLPPTPPPAPPTPRHVLRM